VIRLVLPPATLRIDRVERRDGLANRCLTPIHSRVRATPPLGVGAWLRSCSFDAPATMEPDGLKQRVVRAARPRDVSRLAGLIKVPARGVPRRLEDFDPAVLAARMCTRDR